MNSLNFRISQSSISGITRPMEIRPRVQKSNGTESDMYVGLFREAKGPLEIQNENEKSFLLASCASLEN